MREEPSDWAKRRFGTNAVEVRRRVPQALSAAVCRALDAHTAAKMTTDHAFGNARWPLQYEELVNHLRNLPDTSTIRAPNTFVELAIVNDHLLVPWYYADHACSITDNRAVRRLTALMRELLRKFGPEPGWRQPSLPLDGFEEEGLDPDVLVRLGSQLDQLDPAPSVVIVGYAGNSRDGLLDAWWGEAALAGDRLLDWRHLEQLSIPPPHIPRQRGRGSPDHQAAAPLD